MKKDERDDPLEMMDIEDQLEEEMRVAFRKRLQCRLQKRIDEKEEQLLVRDLKKNDESHCI